MLSPSNVVLVSLFQSAESVLFQWSNIAFLDVVPAMAHSEAAIRPMEAQLPATLLFALFTSRFVASMRTLCCCIRLAR